MEVLENKSNTDDSWKYFNILILENAWKYL